MQETQLQRTKGYIFPQEVRQFYFICYGLSFAAFSGLIIFMFVMAIKQTAYQGIAWCFTASVSALFIYCIVVWVRNRKLLKATYSIDYQSACNTTENNDNITIFLQKAVRSEFTYRFYFAKGSIDEKYIVFSNETVSSLPGNDIYKTVRKVWQNDAVIIPKMAVEIRQGKN